MRAALLIIALLAGCTPGEDTPREDRSGEDAPGERTPPNVILIMADDLGYGDISPYGGWIETPHLQALADRGIRFTDFHSSGNVCSPTRAGLLTGRYQQRLGIPGVLFANPHRPEHYAGIGADADTLAEVLGAAGYRTAIFGKWHLGYQPEFNPTLHGFDEFRGFVSGNLDYHSHIDMMGREDWWENEKLVDEEGYLTDLIRDHSLRFVRENGGRPFFLYLAHHAPHFPFQGPRDPAERTVDGEFDAVGAVADKQRAYREMVQSMDASIGRLVAELEVLGIAEDTVIWFFSDNGAALWGSNAPLRGSKATDWEGGHRVPSILFWPGRVEPRIADDLVSTIDVMPTVLDWANVEHQLPLDGVNIATVVAGTAAVAFDRKLFWGGDGTFWQGAAVREGRWKLLIDAANDATHLFDVSNDIGEQNDLADEQPEQVAHMLRELNAWRAAVEAGPAS